jgi:monoterpene epsilon-lactone hydrolase
MQPIDQVRAMLKDLIGGPDTPFLARRKQAEEFAAAFVEPPGIEFAAGALDGVAVEWIVPEGAHTARVFFHLHGGGYVMGTPAGSRAFTSEFALRTRCRVVSIDYRLAPEHPFPAAIDDSVRAYRALLAQGRNARDIAIGGESAGGGLAVATLVEARSQNLPMPASLIAISPWSDMQCEAGSFNIKAAVDPLLTRGSLKEMADAYLDGADPCDVRASPALADLSGLPPMLIHAGSDEVLLDDAIALVDAAGVSHVEAQLVVWAGMIHVWHMFHAMLPEGGKAIDALAQFVTEKWDQAATSRTSQTKQKRLSDGTA